MAGFDARVKFPGENRTEQRYGPFGFDAVLIIGRFRPSLDGIAHDKAGGWPIHFITP